MAPYVSVLFSISRAIQYTVTRCSTSSPTPNTTAPGIIAVQGTSGACGINHDTATHTAHGMARKSTVPKSPSRNDWPRTSPIRAMIASATVTTRTSTPAARSMLGGLPARVRHTSACTIRNTLSNARVARTNAKDATKNDTMRCSVERSPMLEKAFPARPPMPASRAR